MKMSCLDSLCSVAEGLVVVVQLDTDNILAWTSENDLIANEILI